MSSCRRWQIYSHFHTVCGSLIVSFHLNPPMISPKTVVISLFSSPVFFFLIWIWSLSQDHQMSRLSRIALSILTPSVSHALRFRRGFLFVSLYYIYFLLFFIQFDLVTVFICWLDLNWCDLYDPFPFLSDCPFALFDHSDGPSPPSRREKKLTRGFSRLKTKCYHMNDKASSYIFFFYFFLYFFSLFSFLFFSYFLLFI